MSDETPNDNLPNDAAANGVDVEASEVSPDARYGDYTFDNARVGVINSGEVHYQVNNTYHQSGPSIEDIKNLWQQWQTVDTAAAKVTQERHPTDLADIPVPETEKAYIAQFEALGDEEKLFAIVVYLFPNLAWNQFRLIYERAVGRFLPGSLAVGDATVGPATPLEKAQSHSDHYWTCKVHTVITRATYEYQGTPGKKVEDTINFRQEVQAFAQEYIGNNQRRWLLRLVPLLRELGSDPSYTVRNADGAAIAAIARIDFATVSDDILEGWANHTRRSLRVVAASALTKIVIDDVNSVEVLAQLQQWSSSALGRNQPSWQERWTAASTFRLLGRHQFALVRTGLTNLAHLPDAIVQEYAERFGVGSEDVSRDMVTASSENDDQTIRQLPSAIRYALVDLSIHGQSHEIIGLLHLWITTQQPKQRFPLRDYHIVLQTLELASFIALGVRSTRASQRASASEQHAQTTQWFDALDTNAELRKQLAAVCGYLLHNDAVTRTRVMAMFETWLRVLGDLGANYNGAQRVIANVFFKADGTRRDRLREVAQRWKQNSHAVLRRFGSELDA